MYSNHEFVLLPGEDYGVMLIPTLARGLVTLASAGERGTTLEEIGRQCRASPGWVIDRLRASGALILTIPAPFTVYGGVTNVQGKTRYRYLAWDQEAANRYPYCFSKKKES